MNKQDKEWMLNFRGRTGSVTHEEYKMICEIHSRVFNHELVYVSKCPSCGYVQEYLNQINEVYLNEKTWYNEEQTTKRMNVIGQNGNDGTHY
jgi:TFIIF-interacting CTD phosphatase-like protein